MRKQINNYKNENFDRLVALLTAPGVKQLVYNTNLDVIKYMASLAGLIDQVRSFGALKAKNNRQ